MARSAKEVARLQVELDLKDSELTRALKEVKDLEAEVTRVGSNAGGGRKGGGGGGGGGGDSAASESAILQRTVSKLRVDLKAALRTVEDVKRENTEVKQMLTAEATGEGRDPLPDALNTCRGLEAKRVSLEEKIKYLKREVWDHRQRKQVACANLLATDRQQWNDRIMTLMVAAFTGGGDGRGASPVLQAAARRRTYRLKCRMNVAGRGGHGQDERGGERRCVTRPRRWSR